MRAYVALAGVGLADEQHGLVALGGVRDVAQEHARGIGVREVLGDFASGYAGARDDFAGANGGGQRVASGADQDLGVVGIARSDGEAGVRAFGGSSLEQAFDDGTRDLGRRVGQQELDLVVRVGADDVARTEGAERGVGQACAVTGLRLEHHQAGGATAATGARELFVQALGELVVRERAAALVDGRDRDVHDQRGRTDVDLVARRDAVLTEHRLFVDHHAGAAAGLGEQDLLTVPVQRGVLCQDVRAFDVDVRFRIRADG